MAGYPQQLWPAGFFNRGDDDKVLQKWEAKELESILDGRQCAVAANLPNFHLRRRYRSRRERLIVFSNLQYHQGALLAFPSAITRDKAVEYLHVPYGD